MVLIAIKKWYSLQLTPLVRKIASGLRKLHMLPRLVYISLLRVVSYFIQVLKQLSNGNRQNKYTIKNKKGIVTKTQMAFFDSA